MKSRIVNWLNYYYPQNYIFRKPFIGTLILSICNFGFLTLYKPFNTHASGAYSFEITMALYGLFSTIFIYLSVKSVKTIKYFSKEKKWTILKEFESVFFILLIMGIALYIGGFFIEGPGKRWNILTFMNSIEIAFLTGIIPLAFFTTINYRNFFSPVVNYNEVTTSTIPENLIRISSQLKKEDLSFYPDEFLYAESDGNYVIFYLLKNNLVKKAIIRNSINNIEQQLSHIPFFARTHRAFIVNLKKVRSKQGNTLGYLLRLAGIEVKIPVSRNNTRNFNRLFTLYHS